MSRAVASSHNNKNDNIQLTKAATFELQVPSKKVDRPDSFTKNMDLTELCVYNIR